MRYFLEGKAKGWHLDATLSGYVSYSPDPVFYILCFFQSIIFDEVDLTDASVAESSTKNVNNSFTVEFIASLTILPV